MRQAACTYRRMFLPMDERDGESRALAFTSHLDARHHRRRDEATARVTVRHDFQQLAKHAAVAPRPRPSTSGADATTHTPHPATFARHPSYHREGAPHTALRSFLLKRIGPIQGL